ncbi:MAG: pitrilysin family protein [Deltaproteobacteria bacterium]|nr:pitrilysin family protein [Deltaproteobacteria bacterium]
MVNKTELKNGVRIISKHLDHVRSVSLAIWVNTGSRDEMPSESGVSHFIEHMSFKGTRNRTGLEIAKSLDAFGGLSNAFTGKENTCFYGRVLGKHFHRMADILSDIFLNPTFNPEDLEREREVIFQEINMMEDSPDDKIHVLFNGLCWADHPMGRSTLGTGETVSAISQASILSYIERFYSPDRILVAAAGDVDHEEMVAYFKPIFENTAKSRGLGKRIPPTSTSGFSIYPKELEQVHICLGGKAASQVDDARFACAILNTVLGGNMSSRLFQEIREKEGLAYSVFSFLSAYMDAGLLGVYAATEPRHVNAVLHIMNREIQKLCNGALAEQDLASAKEHIIGGIYLASESTDNQMMRLARNEFVFGRYISHEEVVKRIEAVPFREVIDVANRIFRNENIAFTALGPLESDAVDRNCLLFN